MDLTDFGMESPDGDEFRDTTDAHYNPRNCRAITRSTGTQCTSGASGTNALCGTHEKSNRNRRVDEFETGPTPTLRDALIEQCEFAGTRAYSLAVRFDTIDEVWNAIRTEREITLGDETLEKAGLVTLGPRVALHPDLDVDTHLYAQDQCIARTQNGDRCPNGGMGQERLCGLHKEASSDSVHEWFAEQLETVRDGDDPSPP